MRRALALALALASRLAFADLFSPGELAKPHHELEGIGNCTQCHPAGQQLSQDSCLKCHVELKPSIARGSGLHGRIPLADRACEKCHKEHQGQQAALVQWGPGGEKGFNHARTGWSLRGAHLTQKCGSCHDKRRIPAGPVLTWLEKRPAEETFLGLPKLCNNCHFDDHRGQLGQACEGCHDEKKWKVAPGFDHAQTEYPLTGKHVKVACEKCHPRQRDDSTAKASFPAPVSETFLKVAPVDHTTCLDCHKDPHDNRFGPRCSSCHSTAGWSVIRNASQERAFHEKTRYPLKGEHLDVACTSCHGPFPGQPARFKGLQFDDCTDCHADAHFGQLTAGKKKAPDCNGCHGVEGFKPVHFSLTQHQTTRFPLEGAHATVGCLSCHPRNDALADRITPAQHRDLKRKKRPELFSLATLDFAAPLEKCDSCHADVHQGQLKDKACTSCHTAQSFSKLAFDHAKDSRYPLTGLHEKVACEKCHAPEKKGQAVRYRGLPTACASCHADVHAGQLAPSRGAVTPCERCHETKGFKPTLFAHHPPFTAFELDGKHATLACAACHPVVQVDAKVKAARYKPLPQTCEGCHADFHQGAFSGFEP